MVFDVFFSVSLKSFHHDFSFCFCMFLRMLIYVFDYKLCEYLKGHYVVLGEELLIRGGIEESFMLTK